MNGWVTVGICLIMGVAVAYVATHVERTVAAKEKLKGSFGGLKFAYVQLLMLNILEEAHKQMLLTTSEWNQAKVEEAIAKIRDSDDADVIILAGVAIAHDIRDQEMGEYGEVILHFMETVYTISASGQLDDVDRYAYAMIMLREIFETTQNKMRK